MTQTKPPFDVECPECEAEPGVECIVAGATVKRWPHGLRVQRSHRASVNADVVRDAAELETVSRTDPEPPQPTETAVPNGRDTEGLISRISEHLNGPACNDGSGGDCPDESTGCDLLVDAIVEIATLQGEVERYRSGLVAISELLPCDRPCKPAATCDHGHEHGGLCTGCMARATLGKG